MTRCLGAVGETAECASAVADSSTACLGFISGSACDQKISRLGASRSAKLSPPCKEMTRTGFPSGESAAGGSENTGIDMGRSSEIGVMRNITAAAGNEMAENIATPAAHTFNFFTTVS